LFIDFEKPKRLRVNGTARVSREDPLIKHTVGAQLIVRLEVRAIFPDRTFSAPPRILGQAFGLFLVLQNLSGGTCPMESNQVKVLSGRDRDEALARIRALPRMQLFPLQPCLPPMLVSPTPWPLSETGEPLPLLRRRSSSGSPDAPLESTAVNMGEAD
jgi:hypothetical protein